MGVITGAAPVATGFMTDPRDVAAYLTLFDDRARSEMERAAESYRRLAVTPGPAPGPVPPPSA